MRKTFLILLCFITFIQGCSRSEYSPLEQENLEAEINLPKTSDDYGKAVAKEIRNIVNNLNDKGYNFSEIKSKKEIEEFNKQVYAASSVPELASTNNNNFFNSTPLLQNRYNEITENQQKIIDRIANSYGTRKSDQDFKNSLSNISKDIYKRVPKIEQERLFNIIAVLYHSLSEIQQLEKKGELARHNRKDLLIGNTPRLKAFSESGEGSTGTTCRQEQSAFAVAIGYINSLGEKATQVITQAAAGAMGAYLITWCMNRELSTQDYCVKQAKDCVAYPWKNGVRMDCQACLQHCVRVGTWKCPVYE
ncbi:MAG: hypothetical protein LBF27_16345 [Sphingobacterium sp.]|jgi:hypothetical protein|nr:hypothetical protein [Sphingobacterium sp.]